MTRLLFILLLLLELGGCQRVDFDPDMGQPGEVLQARGQPVLVTPDLDNYGTAASAMVDPVLRGNLLQTGVVFAIPQGTLVKVLEVKVLSGVGEPDHLRWVAILEGEHLAEEGWTNARWLGVAEEEDSERLKELEGLVECSQVVNRLGRALVKFQAENDRWPYDLTELASREPVPARVCPVAGRDTYSGTYRLAPVLYCQGDHHVAVGAAADHPRFELTSDGLVKVTVR